MGWQFPWVSAQEGDFNFDFGASFTDEQLRKGIEYNYPPVDPPILEAGSDTPFGELAADTGTDPAGYMTEAPGLNAFVLSDGVVYHTYSRLAPDRDFVVPCYHQLLDRTPKGRVD